MRRFGLVLTLFVLNACGILFGQQKGADPAQRYFRLICLVHLTGSGQAGDPVVPEYVVQGTAVAQAAATAVAAPVQAQARPAATTPVQTAPTPGGAPMASRPGYLAWSMLKSDDGTMAIIQIVAADHHAFDSILADTRPEIRVFEIGKDSPATIQAAMQQYRASFDLNSFQVRVQ